MFENSNPMDSEDHIELVEIQTTEVVLTEVSLLAEVARLRTEIETLLQKVGSIHERLWTEGIDPEDQHAQAVWTALKWLEYAGDPEAWS